MAAGRQPPFDGGDSCKSAHSVYRGRRVDVVDLEKGECGLRARRSRLLLRVTDDDRRENEADRESRQRAASHCDTCERSTFPPDRMTPTRAPAIGIFFSNAAAAASAPVGSTTSLSRSQR